MMANKRQAYHRGSKFTFYGDIDSVNLWRCDTINVPLRDFSSLSNRKFTLSLKAVKAILCSRTPIRGFDYKLYDIDM